jgi:GNAT superfamily N-acetyltransferase
VFASGGWCELGPFFALDAFRGRGVGKLVIQIAVETNRDSKRSLYGVTKNPIVKAIFARHGLHETALMRLPLPVMTYLVRKMSPERIARNLRKLNADEHAAHFIALQEAHP